MEHPDRRDEGQPDRRDVLRGPLDDIAACCRSIEEVYREGNRGEQLSDLKKILAAEKDLRRLVDGFLDSAALHDSRDPLVAKGAVSDLRHDLRTSLNALIGYSEILMEDAEAMKDGALLDKLRSVRSRAMLFQSRIGDVVVPCMPGAGGRKGPHSSGGTDAGASREGSLLVVDDNISNRELLVRHLEKQGHSVTGAESGSRALDILKERSFDMILLDVVMPGMDGLEVLEKLKGDELWRDIPVVMISSLEEMDVVVESIQKGAEDYLLKPFNAVLLGARIGACLENKRLREQDVEQRRKLTELEEALELREWQEEFQFVAESPAMRRVLSTAHSVSRTPVSVMVHGDSGTGKEAIARLIHRCSDRRDKPFIPVNCASIPETLVESEFFGYEKGAFTGAVATRRGRFEEAHGGTLFLDEIADMPQVIQPKFLRAIQEGEGTRLGSSTPVRYDLRIISATNKDLRREVAEGRFREDLFYRIFSVEIHIPALRERREDIVPLTLRFVRTVSERFGRRIDGCSPEVLAFFEEYPWPGNVRQLIHEVERMVALTPEGRKLTLEHSSRELQSWRETAACNIFSKGSSGQTLSEKLATLEQSCIRDALGKAGGNKTRAAGILGITRQGLEKKIKRHGI